MKLFFYVFFLSSFTAVGQEFSSTRALGIGNAASTLADEWAGFHNPAGLRTSRFNAIGLGYKQTSLYEGSHEVAVAFVHQLPSWKGNTGISIFRYGNDWYSNTSLAVGFASELASVRLGGQLEYKQIQIEEMGVERALLVNFGGIVELLKKQLFWGAYSSNIFQASIRDELLPVNLITGLSYRVENKVMLNLELEKQHRFPSTVKLGLEYEIVRSFFIRTGISTKPFAQYYGIGIKAKSIELDYALVNHTKLGFSHQVSLLFFIKKLIHAHEHHH